MSIKRSKRQWEKLAQNEAWRKNAEKLDLGNMTIDELCELNLALLGRVVLPSDPDYNKDRQESNPAFQAYPKMIVYCEVPADVKFCLYAANTNNLWVALRSGGHSTAGYSVNDGMVIDTSGLRYVHINKADKTAVVGAGTNFGTLNNHLNMAKLHVPGGACQDVCVAGFMQGGGFGYTSRKYGMNIDNVISITMMLRDGKTVIANNLVNRDLFWAVRGGTGGNFGILLDITYQLHDLWQLWGFCILWDISDAAEVMLELQSNYMKSGAPDELCYMGNLATHKGRQIFALQGMYSGARSEGLASLKSLLAIGSASLVVDHIAPYYDMDSYLDNNPFPIPNVPDQGTKEDKQAGYISKPMSMADWQTVVDYYTDTEHPPFHTVVIEPYGGAINRPDPREMAFIHRDVDMDFFVDVFWQTPAEEKAAKDWLNGYMEVVSPFVNGHVYQNYPRRTLEDYRWNYWGENFRVLLAIREKYDPDPPFFHYEQSISAYPAGEDPGHVYNDAADLGINDPIVYDDN